MRQHGNGEQGVDPIRQGVAEAVRDDDVGDPRPEAAGPEEVIAGDVEAAVAVAGDGAGPQPALARMTLLDVRPVPADDLRVGDRDA